KPYSEAVDLAHGLVIVPRGGKKWRSAVKPVGPHLRFPEDVIQRSIRRAWRPVQDPLEQPACGLLDFSVAGQLARAPVRLAAHCRIRRSSLDHHAQSSIGNALHNGGLGEQNDVLVITSLQESLGQDALFPVPAFHGQPGRCGLFDSALCPGSFFADGRASRARKGQSSPPQGRTTEPSSAVHVSPPNRTPHAILYRTCDRKL